MTENEPTQTTDSAATDPALEEADVEGHSMNYEYVRSEARERQRSAENTAHNAARLGERARSRSLLDRIRGR
jgi:predicted exporter